MKRKIWGLILLFFIVFGAFVIKVLIDMKATTKEVFYSEESKLWAHLIDFSVLIPRAFPEFKGMEFDVVYEEGGFNVRHHLEADRGEELMAFFQKVPDVSNHYYWIDFKNLTELNQEKARAELVRVFDELNIWDKAIVESQEAKCLGFLSKKNIKTSYWIPHFEFDLNESPIMNKAVREIRSNLNKHHINAISVSYLMAPYLVKNFSDCSIHLWTNGLNTEEDKEIIKALNREESIKVILVDYNEDFLKGKDSKFVIE